MIARPGVCGVGAHIDEEHPDEYATQATHTVVGMTWDHPRRFSLSRPVPRSSVEVSNVKKSRPAGRDDR